jgi:hypothetical protein
MVIKSMEINDMPNTYKVQPGDTLNKIASKHGFNNYRDIYDHPSNAALRAKRPNPNLIFPGDVIVIPDKGSLPLTPSIPPLPSSSPCDVAGSRYSTWSPELLATLCNNFKLHGTSVSGVKAYPLKWQFGFDPPYKTFSNLIQMLDSNPSSSDVIKEVYDRIALHPGLWKFFFLIFNTWKSRNTGFKFCCENAKEHRALHDYLEASVSFCRDSKISQVEHQEYPNPFKNPSSIMVPTHQCWREIAHGTQGLHICLSRYYSQTGAYEGKSASAVNDVHIDPQQPTSGRNSTGECEWTYGAVFEHWWHEYGPGSGR